MQYEVDRDTNHSWSPRNNPKESERETQRIGNPKKT